MDTRIIKGEKLKIRMLRISERYVPLLIRIESIEICHWDTVSTDILKGRILKYIIIHSDELQFWNINRYSKFFESLSFSSIERFFSLIHSSTGDIVDSYEWLVVAFSEEYLILRVEKEYIHCRNRYVPEDIYIEWFFDEHISHIEQGSRSRVSWGSLLFAWYRYLIVPSRRPSQQ